MSRRWFQVRWGSGIWFGMLLACAVSARGDEPSRAAITGFNAYVNIVEARLTRQHLSQEQFLAPVDRQRMRAGEVLIENVHPPHGPDLPGAMLHHWRGTAFAPGATAADFERLMRNFADYPRVYSPQVQSAKVLPQEDDDYSVDLRVRQKHVLTVVMDTAYDVRFGRLDERHGWSASRSTAVQEIDDPGTPKERALRPGEAHGFLWRLNSYWSCEERDGGLYLQIESVSLTRSIPAGLAWAVGPFVESVPRESLEFTLRKTRDALKMLTATAGGGSR